MMVGLIDVLADMTGQTGLCKRRRDDVSGDGTAGNVKMFMAIDVNGQWRSLERDKVAETTVSFTNRT